jgi:hypothetical protein
VSSHQSTSSHQLIYTIPPIYVIPPINLHLVSSNSPSASHHSNHFIFAALVIIGHPLQSIIIEASTCMPLKKMVPTCVPLKRSLTLVCYRPKRFCPLRHSVLTPSIFSVKHMWARPFKKSKIALSPSFPLWPAGGGVLAWGRP